MSIQLSPDEMIVCLVRQSPTDNDSETELPFEIWWERIADRVVAWQKSLATLQAAEAKLATLQATVIDFPDVVTNWDQVKNVMSARELLHAQIQAEQNDIQTEQRHTKRLQEEVVNLADLRKYRGMKQPKFKMLIDGEEKYVTVMSNGNVIVTPSNQSPQQPD